MTDRRVLILAFGIASLSAFAGYTVSQRTMGAGGSPEPTPVMTQPTGARDMPIKDLQGGEHTLAEWAGKVLVVNFWATWCPPCVKEIPAFVDLQTQLGARGLQFVGIALDEPLAAGEFAANRAVNYPMLAGGDDVTTLMHALGNEIGALPYTVVLDRQGKIVHTHQGEWSLPAAKDVLEPLLAPPINRQQVTR